MPWMMLHMVKVVMAMHHEHVILYGMSSKDAV